MNKIALESKGVLENIIKPYRGYFHKIDISARDNLVELTTQSTKDGYSRAIVIRISISEQYKQISIPNIYIPEAIQHKRLGKKMLAEIFKLGKRYGYDVFLTQMVESFYYKMLNRGAARCDAPDALMLTEYTDLGRENKLYDSVVDLKFGETPRVDLTTYGSILNTLSSINFQSISSPIRNLAEIINLITEVYNLLYNYVEEYEDSGNPNQVVTKENYERFNMSFMSLGEIIDKLSEILRQLENIVRVGGNDYDSELLVLNAAHLINCLGK